MGLAASQARFLAITARKMNCEFQSMQIAQEKLSVTRDLETASRNYQTALTATKLVWDTGDDNIYDLSYDIMMNPSTLNEFDPYLVTDTQGKIVLSEAMFKAAVDAGIIDETTGDPIRGDFNLFSESGRDKFVDALGRAGAIDGSTANMVKAGEYTKSGAGGEIYDKTLASALTTTAFINYLQKAEDENGKLLYSLKDEDSSSTLYSSLLSTAKDFENSTNSGDFAIKNSSSFLTETALSNTTLGDLLNGNYYMYINGSKTECNDKIETILEHMAKLLGYNAPASECPKGLNVDIESANALAQALDFTKTLLIDSHTLECKGEFMSSDEAKDVNVMTYSEGKTAGKISLTNLLKSFLTNYAIALHGFDCGYIIQENSAKKSNYVTDDLGYYFLLENDGAQTDQEMLTTDFYNMLYNQLCMNGACTDKMKRDQVTDKEYLAHGLKNGQLFVSSLNNDGYYYQGVYTASAHIAEVPDEDAIARAEVEYNVTKSKLNSKEETLELQMKNLDMEISALTSEYDTVKNLISKGIEKVFTMFST